MIFFFFFCVRPIHSLRENYGWSKSTSESEGRHANHVATDLLSDAASGHIRLILTEKNDSIWLLTLLLRLSAEMFAVWHRWRRCVAQLHKLLKDVRLTPNHLINDSPCGRLIFFAMHRSEVATRKWNATERRAHTLIVISASWMFMR